MVSLFVSSTCSSRGTLNNQFSAVEDGFRINIKHVDSNRNYSKLELLQRGMERGRHRLASLSSFATSSDDSIRTPVHAAGLGAFFMDIAIGTPPTSYSAIMDTGSDLIWTQCKPCVQCYKQPTPIFDPIQSSSFSKLSCSSNLCQALKETNCNDGCEYIYRYGSGQTQGVMASETFTFDQVPVPSIGFGCGKINQGDGLDQGAGLVGLGRGPLSLVSQLGTGKFSYCLTSFYDSKTSSLLFGSLASSVNTNGAPVTTPMVQNPSRPSFYYLSLEGITVGSTLLPIEKSTFEIKEDGMGGVFIDSGTTLTYLEDTAFELVINAFKEQINLPEADENSSVLGLLCFSLPSDTTDINVPKLIFHFDGADLDLPGDNYMIVFPNKGVICLAMKGSTSGKSIIGNIMQQNTLVLHDLDKQTISFTPTKCDQL